MESALILSCLKSFYRTAIKVFIGQQYYPIFVSKLGYKDEPSFIANVRHVWWNDSAIIIKQNNNSWWIVTAVDSQLSYGDKYIGPLSEQRKDSIILTEKISIEQMKHRYYE